MSQAAFWSGTRALVTGATGFIGAHLTRRLLDLGAVVHAVGRRPPERSEHGEVWHAADLGDPEASLGLIRRVRPDHVFHLASEVTGARDPAVVRATLDGNLGAAINLLTAATEVPVRRLVLAGSVEEPREGDPTPSSPYAAAKWAATGYARMFRDLWGVPVTVLRVAMVYGPGRQSTARLVPHVALSLLRGEDPAVSSGTRLVDWVYVDDVVEAFLLAAEIEAASGRVLDVGGGGQVTVRETVELLARLVGGTARPRFGAVPDRPLDRPQVSDIGPTADVLGWRPAVGLEEGLRRTVAWYAEHR
ncbi:NAD-dependent epimerase/dehydratase family protein [Thermopolyspora sp. NPDC052614]|uniref:NAD-dependent epimerase/dehydratase family protein n=1 Tax=Thermopolyspora sp. NPDC052614 TaxID=3155682 RepID=UPI00341CA876